MTTPRLGIRELGENTLQKSIPHNDGFQFVDRHCQLSAKDITNTPPGSPALGDTYILATSPTGAWSGKAKNIAYWRNGWYFLAPFEGLAGWVRDENKLYVYSGTAWQSGSVSTFSDLTDVDLTSQADGDMVRYDGSDWVNEKPIFDVTMYRTAGAPTASEVLLEYYVVRDLEIPAGMTASYFAALDASTAQTDIDVQKNGSSVGTIRFAAAGTVATFIMGSPTTLASGDQIALEAPGSPDATLGRIAGVIAATRS